MAQGGFRVGAGTCVFHTRTVAVAECTVCGNPLCDACNTKDQGRCVTCAAAARAREPLPEVTSKPGMATFAERLTLFYALIFGAMGAGLLFGPHIRGGGALVAGVFLLLGIVALTLWASAPSRQPFVRTSLALFHLVAWLPAGCMSGGLLDRLVTRSGGGATLGGIVGATPLALIAASLFSVFFMFKRDAQGWYRGES